MTPEEVWTWWLNQSDETRSTLPFEIKKKNKTPSQYKAAFVAEVNARGSLTFPEAKKLGIIPSDMTGDTFRKCVVKGSGLEKQIIKKGVPAVFHTKGNARLVSKTYSEANAEAAKSVVPLFNGYQTVDPLRVMKDSGNYTFVNSLVSDKSAKVKFLDMVYTEAISEGWDLNSTTFKFTKRREVQL